MDGVTRIASGCFAGLLLFNWTSAHSVNLAQDLPQRDGEYEITVNEGTEMAAAASPDRRWIAIDLLGGIWILPFSGGEAKRITPSFLEARLPSWAPDSARISFQGFADDGHWHAYVVSLDGARIEQLTDGDWDDREPAWSHDGSRILFSSDRGGGIPTIWEIGVGPRSLRQITARAGSMPCWVPGDEGLVFVSDTGQPNGSGIWRIDPTGQEQLIVPAPPNGAVGSPACGSRLAFRLADASGVHLIANRIITVGEDISPARPQWLSGLDVLYVGDGQIKRRSQNGLVNVIPFRATMKLFQHARTRGRRELEPTAPQTVRGIVSPVVSPDGTRASFVALGDLWVTAVEGFPTKLTDDSAVEVDPSWSPDGTRIAYASDRSGQSNLWIHDLVTARDVQVTPDGHTIDGIAWSPNGELLAYLVDHGTVMSINVKNGTAGAPIKIGEISRPSWSFDNRTLIAWDLRPTAPPPRGLDQAVLFSIDGVVRNSISVRGNRSVARAHLNGPVWSRDGQKIVFASDGKLWLMNVNPLGASVGSPKIVAEDLADSPSWQSDSEHVVYVTPTGLRRVSIDDGVSERIGSPFGWVPNPAPARVVVHVGQLFDGRCGEPIQGMTDVIVDHGRISQVQLHSPEQHGNWAIDLSDQTAVPGLIDTRVALDRAYGEALGRIWLSYGVTSVRDRSTAPYAALEQREAIAHGRRLGPRVFVGGDPLERQRVDRASGFSVATVDELDAALSRATILGLDHVAVGGRLGPILERRLLDYTREHGLTTTTDALFPALTGFGFDGIEGIPSRARTDVVSALAKSGITVAPMLSRFAAFEAMVQSDPTVLRDARVELFPRGERQRLRTLANSRGTTPAAATLASYRDTVKLLADAGARIVTGTDAGPSGRPYGLTLHAELEQFVGAGMRPCKALQTATLTAAEALGRGGDLGTIEPGKLADLAFIGGNPLDDIRRLRDIRGVMVGGRYYSLTTLLAQTPP